MIERGDIEEPFETQQVDVDGISMWLPFLRVRSQDGEEIILHPFNTLIRQFEDESIDHVEVKIDGKTRGIQMDEEILDQFIDYDFSYQWNKIPDKQTVNWLAEIAMSHIDEEIDELEGQADES